MADETFTFTPPATPTAPPATPTLPATTSLPGDAPAAPAASAEPAPPNPDASRQERGNEWDNLFTPGTPNPKVDPPHGVPPTPPAATPPATPAVPATPATPPTPPATGVDPPKPPTVPETPKLPEGDGTTDELPEDLFDGIPKEYPKDHREAVKRADKLAKRLRLAGEKIGKQSTELTELRQKAGSAAPGPEQNQLQAKVAKLEADLQERVKELTDTRDRLYATEITERPEYQEHVLKPWQQVQSTVDSICKKYNQDPKDVWAAYRLEKPEERDAAFTEMLTVMSPRDQFQFNQAIERIPGITEAQKILAAHSKEKLQQFRQQDEEKTTKQREASITTAAAAATSHYQSIKAAMPFLYEVTGDTPEVQQYNQAMKERVELGDRLIRQGVDKMSPELQGKMVHDAVVADFLRQNIGVALQTRDKQIQELTTKLQQTEAAMATLQSEVDAYRGATPDGGGLPPVAGGAGVAGNGVPTLTENIGRHASGLGWTGR